MQPHIFLPTPLRFLTLTIFFFQSTFGLATGKHPANNEESYALRGTVVNSVTGEAIRGALVEVNLNKKKATLSGPDGSFRFEGLPSGQASIRVRKPGYFSEDEVHPLTSGQKVFSTSQEGSPVVIKLFPEGVIFGTIQGDGGEPLEGMQVRLMKKDLSSGRKGKGMQGSVQTDETGTFRFAELLPGSYILSVSEGPSMAPGIRGRQVTTRVKGYSATFFPGAPTEAEASPIKISSGARIQADLLLASKPLVQIAGTIAGQGSGRLSMHIMDAAAQTFPILSGLKMQTGRFQVQGVPPGSYIIFAQGLSASGNLVRARQQVNATSDVTDLHLRMTPARSIPLKIQSDITRGSAEEESKRAVGMIRLLPIDAASNERAYVVPINMNPSEGADGIPGVEPGTYTVDVGPFEKGYVYSARYGSLDLFRENLTIDADEPIQPIELILREDGATLIGSLTLDGKKAHGAVLLYPENAQRLARLVPTDSAGSFEFSRLAPGNYKVLGMDAVDEVEYRDPDFLLKYLPSALDVTLSPGQNATVQLQIVHIGD